MKDFLYIAYYPKKVIFLTRADKAIVVYFHYICIVNILWKNL